MCWRKMSGRIAWVIFEMTNAQTAKIVISFFWTKGLGICFKESAVILLCSGENALC